MPLAAWMRALPNRGHLYERLVLDNLPAGARAVARGGPGVPFDLLVEEPGGLFAWEVKGNELDHRGPFKERRRFSVTPNELAFARRAGDRLRVAFLWLDPARSRFGFRVLPATRVRWKSPSSPKYVLPPGEAFPLDLDLARYHAPSEGKRLARAWDALPAAAVDAAARAALAGITAGA